MWVQYVPLYQYNLIDPDGVCVCGCMYVRMYVYMCVLSHACVGVFAYVAMITCLHVCMVPLYQYNLIDPSVCVCVGVCECVRACACVHMQACLSMCKRPMSACRCLYLYLWLCISAASI